MSQAQEFNELIRRVGTCSKNLLPQVDPVGNYDQGQTYRILAFRLFAHAEVESFLESCAYSIISTFSAANDLDRLPNRIKSHLILHSDMVEHYPPMRVNYIPNQKDQRRIKGILNAHATVVEQNNGAGEKDVLKLFSPLLFSLDWFDKGWLQSMRELTVARGEVAHRSALSTIIQPTPQDERRRLVRPLWGLRSLADEADRIIKSV